MFDFRRIFLFFLAFLAVPACAMPRVGALRALKVVTLSGAPVSGNLSEPSWESSDTLFFTREAEGTRNVWRAVAGASDGARFPVWRAAPVTNFEAPFFAAQPVALGDGNGVLLVTNGANVSNTPESVTQIALFDPKTNSLRALTGGWSHNSAPALSPDGKTLAFVSDRGGADAIFVMPFNRARPGSGAERRFAAGALAPAWLKNGALFFTGTRPGSRGIFRQNIDGGPPTLLGTGSGEITAFEDGGALVWATPGQGDVWRLYWLASDGSGLRALPQTDGARHPALRPDDAEVAFDAPLGDEKAASRGLWLLSFSPERAIARISEVRPAADGTLGVIGTLQGPPGCVARLEVGEGTMPTRWTALPIAAPPVTNGLLSLWSPPYEARGTWTLRLVLTPPQGEASEDQQAVWLPVSAGGGGNSEPPAPIPAPTAPPRPNPRPFPRRVPQATPKPAPTPRATPPPPAVVPGVVPRLPLPALPPPPHRDDLGTPTPPIRPIPAPGTMPKPPLWPSMPPAPSKPAPTPLFDPAPLPVLGRDAGRFNIAGTLATMTPGQSTPVVAWVENSGERAWESGSGGDSVRLVARWVDFNGGTRRKWVSQWLKAKVEPGGRAKWEWNLAAPTRPGRYKLIYGLLRLPPDGKFAAPLYNANQNKWPGEFAAIAFAVEVR